MRQIFVKHILIYGLSTLLVQAGSFLLLPLYLRCLTPSEYGSLELYLRLSENFAALLLLNGIRQALFTYYQQADTDQQRNQVASSLFFILCIALISGSFLVCLITMKLPYLFFADNPHETCNLLMLSFFIVLIEPFALFPLTLFQARLQSTSYLLTVISQFICRVSLCIVFVRYFEWGTFGALLGSLVTVSLFGAILCTRELSFSLCFPSFILIKSMIFFALPLLPGSLCFFILNYGDRYLLAHYHTLEEVGHYSLAYKLALLVRVLAFEPLFMVWSSRMYHEAGKPDAAYRFGRQFTRTVTILLFTSLALSLFSEEIILILAGKGYSQAAWLVGPISLAYIFQSAATLMEGGFYIRRKTAYKLPLTFLSAISISFLYWFLIPSFGMIGATIATLGGFFFLAFSTYLFSQHVFPVVYDLQKVAVITLISLVFWVVGIFIPCTPVGWIAKLFMIIFATILALLSGVIYQEDKDALLQMSFFLIGKFRNRFSPIKV